MVAGSANHSGNLFLCEHGKSRPAPPTPSHFLFCFDQETGPLPPPFVIHPDFFPFSTNRPVGSPVSTTFPPLFPLEPSPRFMLQLSRFLPCLDQVLDSTVWTSFTCNSSKIYGFGIANGSRKRSTCIHVGSWGSRARPVLKEDIPEGHRDVATRAAGGRIYQQYGRGE